MDIEDCSKIKITFFGYPDGYVNNEGFRFMYKPRVNGATQPWSYPGTWVANGGFALDQWQQFETELDTTDVSSMKFGIRSNADHNSKMVFIDNFNVTCFIAN